MRTHIPKEERTTFSFLSATNCNNLATTIKSKSVDIRYYGMRVTPYMCVYIIDTPRLYAVYPISTGVYE